MKTLEQWASWAWEVVRGVSLEQATFLVAFLTFLVAFLALIATVVYGEIQRRRRPRLVLSLRDPPLTYSGMTVEHADAVLHFQIANTGRTTAHSVYCDLRLEGRHPIEIVGHGDPLHYQIGIGGDLSPALEVPYRFSLNVRVHSSGPARVTYTCWCDELRMPENYIEFEVAPAPADAELLRLLPDFATDKTWQGPPRVGERVTFHITATNQGGTALSVDLWDELPSNMQYVSHTGTDVDGGAPRESMRDPFPPGTIAGNAICRYDRVWPGESVTMGVTVIPTEAGTFTNPVYVQYFADPTARGSFRISESFDVVVLPSPTAEK